MNSFVGLHINSSVKQITALSKFVYELNGNIVQLFVSPEKFHEKTTKQYYTEFKDYLQKNNMKCVVHATYSINLAREWNEYSPWIIQFIYQIEVASYIGAFCIVVHLGKSLELEHVNAYNNMYSSLLYIHNKTKEHENVKILIETSSGQGTEMCYKIEDFAYFFKKLSRNSNKSIAQRFGICIDTCHIFAAGYDITSEAVILMFIEAFEELIGLKHVHLIHLNDSKKELGSNVDRHANIGLDKQGKIGINGLKFFATYFLKLGIPIILETPGNGIAEDLVKLLKWRNELQLKK